MDSITKKLADALEEVNKHCFLIGDYIGSDICREALAEYREQEKKPIGETSDGYHTFNELYDHRCLLWINYCLTNPDNVYLVENHFDGWFLIGKETKHGQISYHCPNKFFNLVANIERKHSEFDGHTSNDVIKRLILLSKEKPKTVLVELDKVLIKKIIRKSFDIDNLLINEELRASIPNTLLEFVKAEDEAVNEICQTFGTNRVSVEDIKNLIESIGFENGRAFEQEFDTLCIAKAIHQLIYRNAVKDGK